MPNTRTRQLMPLHACLLAAAAGVTAVADLRDDIEMEVRRADIGGATVAVSVQDAGTGSTLFALNADRMLIPASNMKLLTSGAALHVLGPDFEFQTRLLRAGQRLIVVGDGDAGFGDPELLALMELDGVPGLDVESFLDLWVGPVAATGVEHFTEIAVDDRVFDRQFIHSTWPADQLNRRYCAEVTGLAFHGNVLHFYPRPGGGPRPNLDLVAPQASWLEVINQATTRQGVHDRNDVWIARKRDTNVLTVYGNVKYPYRTPAPVTLHDVPTFFARLLADRLARAGVEVDGVRRLDEQDPEAVGELAAPIISTPMSTALVRCNRDSENLYAESLLKRLAHELTSEPGSWGKGTAIVRHVYHERVGDSNLAMNIVIADGSGLSGDNRVAAATMTAWLNTFHDDPRAGPIFIESLARAGATGTLSNRFRHIDVHGTTVHAKSGYIRHTSCLSGYVTAPDGRRRSFSILVNNLRQPGSVGRAKKMQERIVSAIAWDMTKALAATSSSTP